MCQRVSTTWWEGDLRHPATAAIMPDPLPVNCCAQRLGSHQMSAWYHPGLGSASNVAPERLTVSNVCRL